METLSLNASLYRQFTTGYLKLSDILVTIRYFQNEPTRNKQIRGTTNKQANKQEATTTLKQAQKNIILLVSNLISMTKNRINYVALMVRFLPF